MKVTKTKLKIWSTSPESALAFFGLPSGTPIRVVKDGPTDCYEREKYSADAKLYEIEDSGTQIAEMKL